MQEPLDISHPISSALHRGEPVVALESCLIAHGLPAEVGVKTALEMEEQVRRSGAVPAIIGVIEGKIRIGLTKEEMEKLAAGGAAKIAVRDMPHAIARKLDGGTTVSATMRFAAAAGIQVVATGGIGGVHRGFAESLDISADLWELVRTPVIVICSGAKAIVDIPATMEWLETHGVPVYGYETDVFPAFYSRSSGISVSRIEGACDLVEVLTVAAAMLGFRCGAVIGVPIPESDEIDVSDLIEQAVREASANGIGGKALTPYLLTRVGELTGGRSVSANTALLRRNAQVAGEIAVALAQSVERRMGFTV